MTEEHKSFLRSKCSKSKTVDMPKFPQQNLAKTSGGAPSSDEKEGETSPSEQQENDSVQEVADSPSAEDSDKHSEQEEDGSQQEELWGVTKVLSIEDLKECPIVCSGECNTLAAVVYKSSLTPNEKWYSCLDCQVSGYPFEESKLCWLELNNCILCCHSNRKQILAGGLRWGNCLFRS
jgi:hypothetical protein